MQFGYLVGISYFMNFLFATDASNNSIRKVDVTTAETFTLAGGVGGTIDGVGTNAQFGTPFGIVHPSTVNYMYVVDMGTGAIRMVDGTTGKDEFGLF